MNRMNIVLVEPEIPPNTGNVARLCAATKSRLHLIEPFGFKLDDAQLKRAGMDYWQHVEWRRWANWQAFAEKITVTFNFRPTIIWFSGVRRRVCRSNCWNNIANTGCGFRCSTRNRDR